MKEAKIFVLDLNPSSNVGSTLGEILSSFPNFGVQLKRESQKGSKIAHCVGELCRLLSGCNSDLIFVVLSPDRLAQGRALFQSISRVGMELPIIVVPEACEPDDILTLLKLGAADFIPATQSNRHPPASMASVGARAANTDPDT